MSLGDLALPIGSVAAFVAAWGATALVRRYAQRRLVDLPNERSSHQVPTPRGGGIAIVLVVIGGCALAAACGALDAAFARALLGGGLVVAVIGFVDDHRPTPSWARFLAHVAAVSWAVASFGGLPAVDFGRGPVELGLVGDALVVFLLVWFVNLYNFMDGIDGIAGVEALSVLAIGAALGAWRGGDPAQLLTAALIAAAVAGFLVWNWPPARIFMGDVGSGFVGYAIGVVALQSVAAGTLSVWVWLILVAAFIADASVTLVRRWARAEPLDQAHRSHAYQRLTRRCGSHRAVTLGFLALNLVYLAPLAALAAALPALGAVLTALAWLPLIASAWWLGAGLPGDLR